MKLTDALRAAKALGHTGPEDAASVAAFLAKPEYANTELVDGTKSWGLAGAIKIDPEVATTSTASTRTVVLSPSGEVKGKGGLDELPGDFQAKVNATIKAGIEDGLKAAGIPDGKAGLRPGMPGVNVGTVKSAEERFYEQRIKDGSAKFDSFETALGFKHWFDLQVGRAIGRQDVVEGAGKKWGDWQSRKAMTTVSATSAGPVVPDAFMPDLIRNVDDAGDYARLVSPLPMTAKEVTWPRRTGGSTSYFTAEAGSITESAPTYDNVKLVAKDIAALAIITRQLVDDSGIAIVDRVVEEMARSQADLIDQCFFIGDGSGTYGHIVGIARKFGTAATAAARVAVGGTTTDATTQANIVTALGLLPRHAWSGGGIKMTCTNVVSANLFDRLATSTGVGGLLKSELVNGKLVTTWMNIPIVFNNHMNNRVDASAGTNPVGFTAADDIDVIIGNFDKALLMGRRMEMELAMDPSPGFATNTVYLRAISRFDINVHNVSTTTGTLVSLWQT